MALLPEAFSNFECVNFKCFPPSELDAAAYDDRGKAGRSTHR